MAEFAAMDYSEQHGFGQSSYLVFPLHTFLGENDYKIALIIYRMNGGHRPLMLQMFLFTSKKYREENTMFCPFCGAETEKEAKFCNKCGKDLTIIGVRETLSASTDRGAAGMEKSVSAREEAPSISIPEETREAYNMLEQSPIPRPKCIRKIKQQKNGLLINGYANTILLLPYARRGDAMFFEKDGAVHTLSLLFLLAYVLCTLLGVVIFVGPIINIFLCIYSYREDKRMTGYMNEVLDRDGGIPLERVRLGVFWIIFNIGICIYVGSLLLG